MTEPAKPKGHFGSVLLINLGLVLLLHLGRTLLAPE